jgi:hypothetical protein
MDLEGTTSCSQKCTTGPILSQFNPVDITIFFFFKIHFNIISHPCTSQSTGCLRRRKKKIVTTRSLIGAEGCFRSLSVSVDKCEVIGLP